MGKDLSDLVIFLDFVRKRHFRKAQEYERENKESIQGALEAREGKRYFKGLDKKIKANYLLYLVLHH